MSPLQGAITVGGFLWALLESSIPKIILACLYIQRAICLMSPPYKRQCWEAPTSIWVHSPSSQPVCHLSPAFPVWGSLDAQSSERHSATKNLSSTTGLAMQVWLQASSGQARAPGGPSTWPPTRIAESIPFSLFHAVSGPCPHHYQMITVDPPPVSTAHSPQPHHPLSSEWPFLM